MDFLPGLDFGFFAFQPLKEASLPHGLPRFFCIFSVSLVFVAGTENVEGKLSDMNMKQFLLSCLVQFREGRAFFPIASIVVWS